MKDHALGECGKAHGILEGKHLVDLRIWVVLETAFRLKIEMNRTFPASSLIVKEYDRLVEKIQTILGI